MFSPESHHYVFALGAALIAVYPAVSGHAPCWLTPRDFIAQQF
jgi:hypothetical protein